MSDIYKAYEEHSKNLRTWLVAYGIGGPVLIVSNQRLSDLLINSVDLRNYIYAFLGGVATQVFLSVLNKNVMWGCYCGEQLEEFRNSIFYKFANWFSVQYWIDLLADLISIVLFIYATFGILNIIFS
jgi:hypothetical protein